MEKIYCLTQLCGGEIYIILLLNKEQLHVSALYNDHLQVEHESLNKQLYKHTHTHTHIYIYIYIYIWVQVNRDGLKLNGTHQLLAYADDVNILAGSMHTLKENAETLVAATMEIGLEVSADKTKYMVMSRDENAGRIQSVRIDNSTFERVEEFKYLGTTLTIQNSIREEIKSTLRSFGAESLVFQVAIQEIKD